MSAVSDVIATLIISGERDYCETIAAKPTLKAAIDKSLTDKGHPELIREDCPLV